MNMPFAEFDMKLMEKINETNDNTAILNYLQNELYQWELSNRRSEEDLSLSVSDYLEKSKNNFQESLDIYSDKLNDNPEDEIIIGMHSMYSYYVTKTSELLEVAK